MPTKIGFATEKDAARISAWLQEQFTNHPETGGDAAGFTKEFVLSWILPEKIHMMFGEDKKKITAILCWVECEDMVGRYNQIIFGIPDFDLPDEITATISPRTRALDEVSLAAAMFYFKQGVTRAFTLQKRGTPGEEYMKGLGCPVYAVAGNRVSIPVDHEDLITRIQARQ